MASTRRKAAAVAIAVVGIAGLSLAAAAQLTVNNSTLQAGTSLTAACDGDSDVDVVYSWSFNDTTDAYVVDDLTIDGVDPACAGETIEVTLVDGSGTALDLGDQVIAVTGSPAVTTDPTWSATGTPAFDMADVDTVAVIIHS